MAKPKKVDGSPKPSPVSKKKRYPKLAGELWSVRELGTEFAMGRDTIMKRIQLAGLAADGERDTHAVYRLCNVIPVLFDLGRGGAMSATDELAKVRAQRERQQMDFKDLELGRAQGRYVLREDAHEQMAALIKPVIQMIDNLGDLLEQRAGISPEQVMKVQDVIAVERDRLAAEAGA